MTRQLDQMEHGEAADLCDNTGNPSNSKQEDLESQPASRSSGRSVDFKPGHDASAVEPALDLLIDQGLAIRHRSHYAYQCMSTVAAINVHRRPTLRITSCSRKVLKGISLENIFGLVQSKHSLVSSSMEITRLQIAIRAAMIRCAILTPNGSQVRDARPR
jgi:hypothetical protein